MEPGLLFVGFAVVALVIGVEDVAVRAPVRVDPTGQGEPAPPR